MSVATEGRLPNLLIAGVPKAGTTSLFTYLTQHSEICGSDVKEPRYFTPLRFGQDLGPIEEYAAHFAHCTGQRYAVEATPGYFYGGRTIARALREILPDPRVVLVLRAPADRCWSWFRFVKARLNIPKDMSFDDYLDRCEELYGTPAGQAEENHAYWGLVGGCYDHYMGQWIDEFGGNLRVVSFEDLSGEPERVVRGIVRWLEIDDSSVADFGYAVENRTQQYRLAGLQRLAMGISRRGERFLRGRPAVKRRLQAAYYAVNRESAGETLSPAARARLVDFYRDHDVRLAEQLSAAGIPLPRWLDGVGGGDGE